MRKLLGVFVIVLSMVVIAAGCSKKEEPFSPTKTREARVEKSKAPVTVTLETVEADTDDPLVYLKATAAAASSFDQTPDWAPEPNPMAPADGDMITRWSSNYIEGPQWIYFDLGKERVVSNVIIRWEKAHAVEYKIQASDNAAVWGDVYHEENGQAGDMEASFSPVKCRYIKILGIKKVNKDWGISIWEVEIYGPQSHNSDVTVLKAAYLSTDEDSKKEEAAALIDKLAAPIVPISQKPFQKGLVYTSWETDELAFPASDFTLAHLKEIGMDSIAIMVPTYQDAIDSVVVFSNDKPGGDTPTDEALKHAVETSHKLGMRVMIKPHVDPRTDEPRINIMPSEKWFDSFEAMTLRYAKFAKENNAELFSIGTELEATTFEAWTHRWNQLIENIKKEYDGVLTYSANWTEYKEVPFWDKMDYIGIDAYFPLTNSEVPTLQELIDAWEGRADEIEAWLKEKGLTEKGVVLTEIGYPSAKGANSQPWLSGVTAVENQQIQADCLEATFTVLTKRPWFKGYYIWQYFPQERWSPVGHTVKDKKAEEVIKKWLKEGEPQ